MKRETALGLVVATLVLGACAAPALQVAPKRPSLPASAPTKTNASPTGDAEDDEDEDDATAAKRNAKRHETFRQPIALPGCTTDAAADVMERIQRVEGRFSRPPRGAAAVPTPTPEAIRAEISAVWAHPCLTHLARIFRAPAAGTFEELSELWHRGLGASLRASVGALYMRQGVPFFVIPPEDPAPLSPDERRALGPWVCPDGEAQCGHAASYVRRAEEAFDDAERLSHAWHGSLDRTAAASPMPGAVTNYAITFHACPPVPDPRYEDPAAAPRTQLESFMMCAASEAPRTWRYPQGIRFRAVEKGWLVVRGRRGHYSFSDEVGVYDLATGAAYIARSGSALVLSGPSVDFAAVDAKRKLDVVTGTVAPDQVRELAFVLATASSVRAKRTEIQLVPVSKELPITLTTGRGATTPFDVAEAQWGSSAHTTLGWQLVDGTGTITTEGSLMWPSSWREVETHADGLLRVLEAGLSPGCAPARLPANLARGRHGAVHPIDADPNAQVDVFADLVKKLEGATKKVCPNVKP